MTKNKCSLCTIHHKNIMSRTAIYIGVNYDWAFYVVGGDLHHDVLLHHPDGAVSAGRHAAGVH